MAKYDITIKNQQLYSGERFEYSDLVFFENFPYNVGNTGANAYWALHFYDHITQQGVMHSLKIDRFRNITRKSNNVPFDGILGQAPRAIKLSRDRAIVCYRGSGNDGFAKLIGRSNYEDYSVLNSIEFDATNGQYHSVISLNQVGDIIKICNFYERNNALYACVMDVDMVNDTITKRGETFMMSFPDNWDNLGIKAVLVPHTNKCMVVVKGNAFSVTIFDDYVQVHNQFNFTGDAFASCDLELLRWENSAIFVCMWQGNNDDGYVNYFTLNLTSMLITRMRTIAEEWDTVTGRELSIKRLDNSSFIVMYLGSGNDGWVRTYSIDNSWDLVLHDNVKFDDVSARECVMTRLEDNLFLGSYRSTNSGLIIFEVEGNFQKEKPTSLLLALN